MGFYLQAKRYLGRALEGPGGDWAQGRDQLSEATRLLLLYPSSRLNPRDRSARILTGRKLALARLAECTQDRATAPAKDSAADNAPAPKTSSNALQSLASRFSRQSTTPTGNQPAASAPVDPLRALAERWRQVPAKLSLADLEKNPEMAETEVQLIYETELITQQVCGAPAGDDALLLRIAQAPNQVEEE
jgi:hypothetical protein